MAALLAGAAGTVGRFLFGSALRTAATTTVASGGLYMAYKHHKAKQNEDIQLAPPQEAPPEITPHGSQYTG